MTSVPAGDQARELLDRVRARLPSGHVREVQMFGTIAVMIDNSMAAALHKDGSLLVRIDPAEDARLLEKAGASRAEMGAGRSMGEGWIRVAGQTLGDDATLEAWLEAAMRYVDKRNSASRNTAH
jgi:TfoX/Sxy family transcriptional regulator of competence genes